MAGLKRETTTFVAVVAGAAGVFTLLALLIVGFEFLSALLMALIVGGVAAAVLVLGYPDDLARWSGSDAKAPEAGDAPAAVTGADAGGMAMNDPVVTPSQSSDRVERSGTADEAPAAVGASEVEARPGMPDDDPRDAAVAHPGAEGTASVEADDAPGDLDAPMPLEGDAEGVSEAEARPDGNAEPAERSAEGTSEAQARQEKASDDPADAAVAHPGADGAASVEADDAPGDLDAPLTPEPGAGGASEVEARPEGDDGAVPGIEPSRLDAARDGAGDDLQRIRGFGPKLAEMLNDLGFYHFDQIAGWTPAEVAWVDDRLEGFKGRVLRDDWIGQARALAQGDGPDAASGEGRDDARDD
ncbi:NADH:ubiquinone oxidoreductase 41 kD complex I subunit [Oceaniovalibus guishaninsula JLT2003]|uniref:NADH:ubiquinone oxidoreductase 41 kD complex I subunit n=1 Tax=Oceaniovalibus guishaninsula JLT2003 TaxID=1231392 RepID=K2HCN8_9RHOB|nr:hypothetical protein [Oceaniovalibus guishaninsula]EKE45153.1 NADH:ubiquinone oxidoreductase 41 kD complex I subunit [Oceaniovalibus guishaninsula JLT2003]